MLDPEPAKAGLFGDVHGDLESAEWALWMLRACSPVLCLGDVVGGASDAACIETLQSSSCLVLQGNHDYWATLGRRSALNKDHIAWLAALPRAYTTHGWCAIHSTYSEDTSGVTWGELISAEEVRRYLAECSVPLTFCAHTHIPSVNVLSEGSLEYLSASALKKSCRILLASGARYVINVGTPEVCVVTYCPQEHELEFVFRDR